MRSMGQNPTEDELLALVMEVDINGDGTIDFQEFLGMMKQKANEADQESDLKEAFMIFDRDKNGYIDMKELKQVGHIDVATQRN
jgi:Ca2+-binding EF-hand superfamily protein